MANKYSNKWLGTLINPQYFFIANTTRDKYYIMYITAKKNVVESNNRLKELQNAIKLLKGDIYFIKDAIDSQDYKAQTERVIQAIDDAVAELEKNMTKLFEAVSNRLASCAESDAWFGDTAKNYSDYINSSILHR